MDRHTPEQRRRNMQAIKNKDSKIEIALRKELWARGFVSFAFRKTVTPENDINNFAFFNEYMQPTEAVITYATVIRFLGNADFVRNVSNEKNLIIDEYTANGNKIEVYYSLGKKSRIAAPEGNYKAFNMYGNEIEIVRKLTVSNSPIYIVY